MMIGKQLQEPLPNNTIIAPTTVKRLKTIEGVEKRIINRATCKEGW